MSKCQINTLFVHVHLGCLTVPDRLILHRVLVTIRIHSYTPQFNHLMFNHLYTLKLKGEFQ